MDILDGCGCIKIDGVTIERGRDEASIRRQQNMARMSASQYMMGRNAIIINKAREASPLPNTLAPTDKKNVQVKHGSYSRYLAKRKAPEYKSRVVNGYTNYGVVAGCEC